MRSKHQKMQGEIQNLRMNEYKVQDLMNEMEELQ